MPKQLHRYFELLAYLKAGNSNIRTLTTNLSVSRRQVYRDIQQLRNLGFLIQINPKTKNYNVLDNVVFSDANFEFEEMMLLLTVCYEAGCHHPIPFLQDVYKAATKLFTLLPAKLQEKIEHSIGMFEILLEVDNPSHAARPFFDAILRAYMVECSLSIHYKDDDQPEYRTLLSPYRLFFRGHNWFVVGYSSLHHEVNLFRLARIRQCEATEYHYTIPKHFSLKQHLKNAWCIQREPGLKRNITIRFSPKVAETVAEVEWHSSQQLLWHEDGSLELSVTLCGLEEISGWVLGYGKEAIVLEPQEFRDLIKSQLEEMTALYR